MSNRDLKKEYYQRDKVKLKEWRNQPEIREKLRKKAAGWNKTPQGKFTSYKYNAKRHGTDFGLTYDEFVSDFWNATCHYCGDEISGVGIDRKDSSIGYIKGNMVPCCCQCNRAKMDHSIIDYVTHCAKVVQNFKMHTRSIK